MTNEAEKIKGYFLGTLAEADAEEIELLLISDAEFEEKVITVENDLVDDRFDGTLSGDEMTAFDQNYLSTPQRIKNFETVGLLRRYSRARAHPAAKLERVENAGGSLVDKLGALFSGIPAIAYAACLIVLVGSAVAYVWMTRSVNSGAIQAEYAALNKQDLGDLDKFKALPLITAVPGSLRGSNTNVKIATFEGSAFVRLALVEFKTQTAFNISLMRGQVGLLNFDAVRSYDSGGGREIRLLIPISLLEKGTYRISVSAVEHPNSPVMYGFTVE